MNEAAAINAIRDLAPATLPARILSGTEIRHIGLIHNLPSLRTATSASDLAKQLDNCHGL